MWLKVLSQMANLNHTPVFLPLGVSRKKDAGSGFKRPPKLTRPVTSSSKKDGSAKQLADLKPGCNNRLLAGCMANELLTKGTLFGQKLDPARAEAAPLATGLLSAATKPIQVKKHERYAEMANLFKSDDTMASADVTR